MSAILTAQEFSRHLNTTFHTILDDGPAVALQLVLVKPFKHNAPEETGMEQFSAFFVGGLDALLPQRTYRLRHEEMGEFDIFLVPISRKEEGYRYEAVFNYFINPQND
jgi:hypothetical protein